MTGNHKQKFKKQGLTSFDKEKAVLLSLMKLFCFWYLGDKVVYIQQTQLLVRWEITYSTRQYLT